MSIRQKVFQKLDSMPIGVEFTGLSFWKMVAGDRKFYPDTALRYLREYRKLRNSEIVCNNKRSSKYVKLS